MSIIELAKLVAPLAVASLALAGCGNSSTTAGSPDTTPDAGDDVTTGGGGPDARADAPGGGGDVGNPSLCSTSNFVFCDGFEDPSLMSWSQTYASGGVPAADQTHVYRGSYALRAHVDASTMDGGTSAYAYVQQIQQWPAHVFVRYFVYQPAPHPPSASSLLDLLQNGDPFPGIEMMTTPPSGGLAMKTYSTGQDQEWASGSGVLASNQWVCLELEVDTVAGTSHLYMNDVEVADLARSNLGLPPLGILGVGLSFLETPPAGVDVWIDEVAVNGARIGCAN